jgi:hypothetical protein
MHASALYEVYHSGVTYYAQVADQSFNRSTQGRTRHHGISHRFEIGGLGDKRGRQRKVRISAVVYCKLPKLADSVRIATVRWIG